MSLIMLPVLVFYCYFLFSSQALVCMFVSLETGKLHITTW